ncbi:MAG TPA: hypothetical protein PLK19_03805 [Mycobacterium sp.]|nr:hypothetical protein [Mycobacterium sp.]
MEAVDSMAKPRAVEPQAKRSGQLFVDAAQVCVVSHAIVSTAREVCARSQQLVSVTEQQRHLRSPDVKAAILARNRTDQ